MQMQRTWTCLEDTDTLILRQLDGMGLHRACYSNRYLYQLCINDAELRHRLYLHQRRYSRSINLVGRGINMPIGKFKETLKAMNALEKKYPVYYYMLGEGPDVNIYAETDDIILEFIQELQMML